MKILKLQLSDRNLDTIVEFLIQEMTFDYENHSADMSVLAKEEFYFRTDSKQLNMMLLKTTKAGMEIDVVGGAGGSGLLSLTFGSEASFVANTRELLERYASTSKNEATKNRSRRIRTIWKTTQNSTTREDGIVAICTHASSLEQRKETP